MTESDNEEKIIPVGKAALKVATNRAQKARIKNALGQEVDFDSELNKMRHAVRVAEEADNSGESGVWNEYDKFVKELRK